MNRNDDSGENGRASDVHSHRLGPWRAASEAQEVRATGFPLNMSGWVVEKATDALERLHALTEIVRRDAAIPDETKQAILTEAHYASVQTLKLLTLGSGHPFSSEDAQRAMRDCASFQHALRLHRDGANYRQRDRVAEADRLDAWAAAIDGCLVGGNEARTLAADLLNRTRSSASGTAEYRCLDDLVERASAGAVSSVDFRTALERISDSARRDAQELRNPQREL